jgi:hypothetical protein
MNFLQRLRLRLPGWPAEKDIGPERVQPREPEEYDTVAGVPPVAFDQVEHPDGSGPSLDTLLEMNRVQGW